MKAIISAVLVLSLCQLASAQSSTEQGVSKEIAATEVWKKGKSKGKNTTPKEDTSDGDHRGDDERDPREETYEGNTRGGGEFDGGGYSGDSGGSFDGGGYSSGSGFRTRSEVWTYNPETFDVCQEIRETEVDPLTGKVKRYKETVQCE